MQHAGEENERELYEQTAAVLLFSCFRGGYKIAPLYKPLHLNQLLQEKNQTEAKTKPSWKQVHHIRAICLFLFLSCV